MRNKSFYSHLEKIDFNKFQLLITPEFRSQTSHDDDIFVFAKDFKTLLIIKCRKTPKQVQP